MKYPKYLTLISCAISSSLFAQGVNDSNVVQLESVSVEINSLGINVPLKKSGLNVSVVTSAEISKLPIQNTQDLMKYLTGVDARQRGFGGVQSDIGIQGSGFDQVLVMINGVRMSDVQTGHHQMNLPIPIEAIERVEIIKGSNARKYGLNAMAGVVNFVTKKSNNSSILINSFVGSSFEQNAEGQTYYNQGHRIFGGFKNRHVNGWISSAYDQGNGYRHNSDFTTFRNMAEVNVPLKKTEMNVLLGGNNNDFGANGFYAAPGDTNSHETVNTVFGNFRVLHELNPQNRIKANFGVRNNYDHYIYRKNNPTYSQNKHTSDVFMGDIQWNTAVQSWNIAVGTEVRKEGINSTNLGKRNRDFYGSFLDIQRQFNRFFFSGGLYALSQNELGFKMYPGVELSYEIKKDLIGFGSYGTGQRLPTFTDLYYKGPTNKSNPNLKPESANSVQLGLRYQRKFLNATVTVFQRNTSQLIDWTRVSLDSAWSPVNYNQNVAKGLEFQLEAIYQKFRLQIGYCGLELDNTQENHVISKNALNYLSNQAIIGLNFPIFEGLSANFQARYIKRNVSNQEYWIYSSNLSYQFKKHFNVYLNLQNISNQKYSEATIMPLPPRWVSFGLIVKMNK